MTALPSTEDLARLAKAITPGPWRRNTENTVCNQIDGEHHAICTDQFCYAPEEQQDANAEAIALLPALIREALDRREAEADLLARAETAEAERDEAMAQVTIAYEAAASIVVTGEPEISPITRHAITALTPADASAAIEAYGREKMRAGMKRAADIAAVKPRRGGRPLSGPHHAGIRRGRSEAARLILAEMETLK